MGEYRTKPVYRLPVELSSEDYEKIAEIVNEDYILLPATDSQLGGIKIGNGLIIDANGSASVDDDTYLTQTDASDTYLTQTDASDTYATIENLEDKADKIHEHSASDITSGVFDAARLPVATNLMQGAMSASEKIKLNSIGTTNFSNGSSVSVGNTSTIVHKTELDPGVWIVVGVVSFEANSSGYRACCIDTTGGSNVTVMIGGNKEPASASGISLVRTQRILILNIESIVYLNAIQSSGSNLTTTGRIEAIKIA